MNVHLLYHNRDFDLEAPLPWQAEALTQDLELTTLFAAMSDNDKFIFQVSKQVVLTGFEADLKTIRYRQEILHDCLQQQKVVEDFYALVGKAMSLAEKQYLGFLVRYPDSVLRRAIEHMQLFLEVIRNLRKFAKAQAEKFTSEGWTRFFTSLQEELSDDYLATIEWHLQQLRFSDGILLSAELGSGNKGCNYRLHRHRMPLHSSLAHLTQWLKSRFPHKLPPHSFLLPPEDEAGGRALTELRNHGITLAARALAQSRDQVHAFFRNLQIELAFYLGCMNLHGTLAGKGEPLCFPSPEASPEKCLSFRGLYDPCLSLSVSGRVVGNKIAADGKKLILITGANQGGKTTFLRSLGQAQLMMQCGMFVAAETFRASLCTALFTHFKREEDSSLKSGKLDEELARMSGIIDHLTPWSIVLMNESFAATNEREGSEIARQVIVPLLEERIRIVCVTHLYDLARSFYVNRGGSTLFLLAEREESGTRTFKLTTGEPLSTSFGEDLYREIFGESPGRSSASGTAQKS